MSLWYQNALVELIENLLAVDKKFFAEKFETDGAATYCAQCRQNKPTGYYPARSIYRRTLCSECAEWYMRFLKQNDLFP